MCVCVFFFSPCFSPLLSYQSDGIFSILKIPEKKRKGEKKNKMAYFCSEKRKTRTDRDDPTFPPPLPTPFDVGVSFSAALDGLV